MLSGWAARSRNGSFRVSSFLLLNLISIFQVCSRISLCQFLGIQSNMIPPHPHPSLLRTQDQIRTPLNHVSTTTSKPHPTIFPFLPLPAITRFCCIPTCACSLHHFLDFAWAQTIHQSKPLCWPFCNQGQDRDEEHDERQHAEYDDQSLEHDTELRHACAV